MHFGSNQGMSIRALNPLVASARTALRTPSAGPSTQTRSATFSLGGLAKLFRKEQADAESTTKDGENLYDDLVKQAKLVPATSTKKQSTFVSPLPDPSARPRRRSILTVPVPQHKSSTANFKTSRRKLNDLSRLIAGRGVDEGVLQLTVRLRSASPANLSSIGSVFRFHRKSNLPDCFPCSPSHETTPLPKDSVGTN